MRNFPLGADIMLYTPGKRRKEKEISSCCGLHAKAISPNGVDSYLQELLHIPCKLFLLANSNDTKRKTEIELFVGLIFTDIGMMRSMECFV